MSVLFRQIYLHDQEATLQQQIKEHAAMLEMLVKQLAQVHAQSQDNHLVLLRVTRNERPASPANSTTR